MIIEISFYYIVSQLLCCDFLWFNFTKLFVNFKMIMAYFFSKKNHFKMLHKSTLTESSKLFWTHRVYKTFNSLTTTTTCKLTQCTEFPNLKLSILTWQTVYMVWLVRVSLSINNKWYGYFLQLKNILLSIQATPTNFVLFKAEI